QQQPGWRAQDYSGGEHRPDWAPVGVATLANQLVTGINTPASVNPSTLLALSTLSAPRPAMDGQHVVQQRDASRDLLAANPYTDITVSPEGQGQEWLHYAEALDSVARSKRPLGDLIQTSDRQAVILAYSRNTVLHLLALPSLLACLFVTN